MRPSFPASALLLPGLLTACSDGAREDSAAAQAVQSADFEDFDAVVSDFVDEQALEGAVAVVVHRSHGLVHAKGYGTFKQDRVFLAGFASKILSAGVLLALEDAGKLDLDAPIGTYLADWGTDKSNLTLASLLSNSSGLVSLAEEPLYAPYLCQYQETQALSECAETIYTASDQADIRPPDTLFSEGGAQWQLAGGIAEVASGKPWLELIDSIYAVPCGLHSLGYTNPFARATQADGASYPAFFQAESPASHGTPNPSIEGGAYLTADDYAAVLLMHLRGGVCGQARVLSEAAVARMQEDRIAQVYQGTAGDENSGYGLGWWVDRGQEGVFYDPGAYGSMAWLDTRRGYGAFLALEATSEDGRALTRRVKPVLDGLFD